MLESLGALAESIAHDFNTLLVSILGHTELALSHLPPGDPIREHIEEICSAANSAAELSNQMMMYSDNTTVEVKSTALNKIISDAGRLMAVSIPKHVRLNYALTEPIPPIKANPLQIQQVVMNLVANASEAVGQKSGSITICSGAAVPKSSLVPSHAKPAGGEYCYVKVTDTGCGIDSATLEKIYEPHFTTKPTGHGLGMAAIARIVGAHNGVIELDTKPGSGTTFTVWFPCSQKSCECVVETPAKIQAVSGSGTVLVVDDEPNVLSVTQAMLQHQGFDAIPAENGQQCIEILTGGTPVDIILLDMTLNGMTAREILQRTRQLYPNLPVVLCSGCEEHEAMKLFANEDLAGFIKKPFSLHGILTALLKVLGPQAKPIAKTQNPKRISATI
ncbi:MAG: response regulator [Phycisphaerae bacterium]|nr:response regulator [Phycisphaerae bacterium]